MILEDNRSTQELTNKNQTAAVSVRADSPDRWTPAQRGQCRSLALLTRSDCSWWTTLCGSAALVRMVWGSLRWRQGEQVRQREKKKNNEIGENLNEGLTGSAQTPFLASEGQGTSWVMTGSLQRAGQLWPNKAKERLNNDEKNDPFHLFWKLENVWQTDSRTLALQLTEQMAAGDALLGQSGLHGGNGGGENVRLLKHLWSVWPVQWAEHSAVVQLHAFIQLNHGELVPTRLGAPVFILWRQTEAGVRLQDWERLRSECDCHWELTTTQFSECTTCTGPLAFLWTASWKIRPVTPSISMIPMKLRSWCKSVLSVTTASRLGFKY